MSAISKSLSSHLYPSYDLACTQIREYLEKTDLLDPCQFAYRRGHSRQICLIRILDNVRHAADNRLVTVSVFFDLTKAFDSVSHDILFSKLKNLNFSGSVLRWIHSYLEGRSHAVRDRFNGSTSALITINASMPQGSVLGPLLFVLYLPDFKDTLRHYKYNLYADDLQIYLHCKPGELTDYIAKVNEDISHIIHWTTQNKITFNSTETQAIIIGSLRYKNAFDFLSLPKVTVGGAVVQYSTQVKYLGIIITNTLFWDKQTTAITKKISSLSNVLYQLKLCKNLLPKPLRQRLVSSLALPHIDYCCLVFTDITA